VRAVSRRRAPFVTAANIVAERADVGDPTIAARLMRDVDYVLLCAGEVATAPVLARDPIGPVQANLRVTSTALTAAFHGGVRKVVWLSSTTGYPEFDGPISEERMQEGEPPPGWTLLGWTTRYLEIQARMLAETSSAHTAFIALRPSLIYGEYDNFSLEDGHFLPSLLRRVVERQRPIEVWGSGEERRDLVHGQDVAAAALAALRRADGHDAFNVAAARSHSVNEILARLIAIDGFDDAEIRHVEGRPRSVAARAFTHDRARERLGFVPEIPLDEGLRRTVRWYRSTGGKAHRGAGACVATSALVRGSA
jgi:GDP-L-fucose synthase